MLFKSQDRLSGIRGMQERDALQCSLNTQVVGRGLPAPQEPRPHSYRPFRFATDPKLLFYKS